MGMPAVGIVWVFYNTTGPLEGVVLFCCVNSNNHTKDDVNCPLSLGLLQARISAALILLATRIRWTYIALHVLVLTSKKQIPASIKKKRNVVPKPRKCEEYVENVMSAWACRQPRAIDLSAELLHPLQRFVTFGTGSSECPSQHVGGRVPGVLSLEKYKVSFAAVGVRWIFPLEDLLRRKKQCSCEVGAPLGPKRAEIQWVPVSCPFFLPCSFLLPALWHNSSLWLGICVAFHTMGIVG